MRSPYLFDRFEDGEDEGVSVTLDIESSTVTLAVHGLWGRTRQRDVYVAIRKCLSEHPNSLVIDLESLRDPHAASVSTWLMARRLSANLNPPVRVLICVPQGTALAARLDRMGAPRFLPTFPSAAQAHAAASEPSPPADRIRLRLTPAADAAARARAAVTDACTAWHLPELADRARLVVSELVVNAVDHAGTPITVVIARRGTAIQVMVRDSGPALPHRFGVSEAPPGQIPVSGLGLVAVHAAATAWGAMPTHDGKAVWATIRPRTARR
ncbi:ATP-binding protein [Actinoplanes aureus]|uniref:ATP-binding protein n=1 Tax=Actinoplanes aureus TaxID=2792083 RepID=A0A931G0Y2_9ACTN|nr:ATP-binding protein [Actinoplanes aureus]MBG0567283.1 ATP-binding protein [Actinoplanes aureus]